MFGLFRKKDREDETKAAEAAPRPRVCEIGWLVDTTSAGFIYGAPRQVSRRSIEAQEAHPEHPQHPKGVNSCPAVVDTESRTFEVPCPIDVQLGLRRNDKGELNLVDLSGSKSTVNKKHLSNMVHLIGNQRWRSPDKPVVQISAPYRFIADEPVWMSQMPAFAHYRKEPLPGLPLGGRFPIHLWPRSLMWAFEWHEPNKPMVLRRGEPWFYVRFEASDPSRPVRLVEAEMTPQLREYCQGLDGVTNYVNQTYQLFNVAQERRPEKLLTKKAKAQAEQTAAAS